VVLCATGGVGPAWEISEHIAILLR
jgi:hypothetical protein